MKKKEEKLTINAKTKLELSKCIWNTKGMKVQEFQKKKKYNHQNYQATHCIHTFLENASRIFMEKPRILS